MSSVDLPFDIVYYQRVPSMLATRSIAVPHLIIRICTSRANTFRQVRGHALNTCRTFDKATNGDGFVS